MKQVWAVANVIIAASVGVIVLLGYFFQFAGLNGFRQLLLQWAFILGGFAVLIGVWNLVSVHVNKIRETPSQAVFSFVLIIFLFLTVAVSFIPSLQIYETVLMNGILVPAEISLIAILAVTLLFAALRFLRVRSDLTAFIFTSTVILVLLGSVSLPFFGRILVFSDWIGPFISNYLVAGGARGILLGVALGAITTGLRILFGADRPYGGK